MEGPHDRPRLAPPHGGGAGEGRPGRGRPAVSVGEPRGREPPQVRRLATRARALHEDRDRSHAVLRRLAARVFRRELTGERRALARALEAARARAGPRHHVALQVGDGDDGVVEGRLDVGDAGRDVLADPLLAALCAALLSAAAGRRCGWFRHDALLLVLGLCRYAPAVGRRAIRPLRGPLRVRALVCVRWPRTGNPRRWRRPR